MAGPDDATLYALIHRGNAGDAEFYRRACHGVDRVLELGCGFGRLMPAILASGARYVGLDVDAASLRLAKRMRAALPPEVRARATLRLGDMRSFSARQRYPRILVPHSALYCMKDRRDVLRCLERVRAHLTDDGELVVDAYNADDFHAHAEPASMTGRERDLLTDLEHEGVSYRVYECTRWSRSRQKLVVRYDYESARGRSSQRIEHHYLLADQLLELMKRAGLEVSALHGSFAGRSYTRRSEHLIVRARRA